MDYERMTEIIKSAPPEYKRTHPNAAQRFLDKNLIIPLNKHQNAALVSFLTTVDLKDSDLEEVVALLNEGDFEEAWDEINLFTITYRRQVKYLTERREQEMELFYTPVRPELTLVVNDNAIKKV